MTAEGVIKKLEEFLASERQGLAGDSYWGPYDTAEVMAEQNGRDDGKRDLLDDLEYTINEIKKGLTNGTIEDQGRQG